jgi:hypothetical protein
VAENRGVAYMGPGTVEVQNIDFPIFELQDGPGEPPDNVGRSLPHRGDPQDRPGSTYGYVDMGAWVGQTE